MADRIEEVQVLLQKRNIRSHGPMASNQINSMQAELVHDLAAISNQWNNRLTPLTEGLPDGSDDSSVDAFLYGLDGKHMYVDQRATLTLNASFFNSSANRPNTLEEQFTDLYSTVSTLREDVESELASLVARASQVSIEDNGNLYSSEDVENALQEVMTVVNTISLSGLTPDLSAVNEHYIPALDNTYDIGSSSYRMRDVYVGPGSFTMIAKSSLGEAPSDKVFAFEVDSSTGKMQILDSTSVMLEMQSTEVVARQTFKVNTIEDGPASSDIIFSPTGQVKVSGADLIVEHDGTSGVFVTARMTETERDALTPVEGMFIYNETASGFEGYTGGAWGEVGGGVTPGGSDTNIQFNNGGAFGASSNLTWTDATPTLFVGGFLDVKRQEAGPVRIIRENTATTSGLSSLITCRTIYNSALTGQTQQGIRFFVNEVGGSGDLEVGRLFWETSDTTPNHASFYLRTMRFGADEDAFGIHHSRTIMLRDQQFSSGTPGGDWCHIYYESASQHLYFKTNAGTVYQLDQQTPSNNVTGTGSGGHLAIWSGTYTLGQDSGDLYWASATQRLGIGTNSPGTTIDIRTDQCNIRMGDGAVPTTDYWQLENDQGTWRFTNEGTGNEGTNVMVMEGTYVGIGTMTPLNNFHVTPNARVYYSADSTSGPNFALVKSRGTEGSPAVPQDGDTLGTFDFRGWDSSVWTARGVRITAEANGTWSSSNHGADLEFHTVKSGTTTLVSRLKIGHDGQVNIGESTAGKYRLKIGEAESGSLGTVHIDVSGTGSGNGVYIVGTGRNESASTFRVDAYAVTRTIDIDQQSGRTYIRGLELGDASSGVTVTNGMLRYTGSDVEARVGGSWVSMTQQGTVTGPAGSDGQIQYNNGGSFGGASALYYDDVNDRVGIGTDTPNVKLQVKDSSQPFYVTQTSSLTSTARSPFTLQHETDGVMVDGFGVGFNFNIKDGSGGNSIANIEAQRDGADNQGKLILRTNDGSGLQDQLYIDHNGRVGIGIDTPNHELQVDNNENARFSLRAYSSTSAEKSPGLWLYRSRGTIGSEANVNNGDSLGRFGFVGRLGSSWSTGAEMWGEATENWGTGAGGARLYWTTVENGTSISVERMCIDHNGNVGIGGTPASTVRLLSAVDANELRYTGVFRNLNTGNATQSRLVVDTGSGGADGNVTLTRYSPAHTGDIDGISNADAADVMFQGCSSGRIYTYGAEPLYFMTDRTLAMTIDSSQRVILQDALTLASTTDTTAGNVRWDGSNFQGYNGSGWVNLDTQGGDVTKVGTPVDNQIGVWTGDGTIEGTTGLAYDYPVLVLTGGATANYPQIRFNGGNLATGGNAPRIETSVEGLGIWIRSGDYTGYTKPSFSLRSSGATDSRAVVDFEGTEYFRMESSGSLWLRAVSAPGAADSGFGALYMDTSDSKIYWHPNGGSAIDLTANTTVPGGSDTQIQYNNGGVIGGASSLIYDDGNGWLGVGAAPDRPLYVSGSARVAGNFSVLDNGLAAYTTANTSGLIVANYSNDPTHCAIITMQNSDSDSIGTNAVTQSGDRLGYIRFQGNSGSGVIDGALFGTKQDAAVGSGRAPTAFVWETANTSEDLTERMRITSAGNVGIGDFSSTTVDALLHVDGNLRVTDGSILVIENDINVKRSGTTAKIVVSNYTNDPDACAAIIFRNSDSDTLDTWSPTQTGDRLGYLQFLGAKTGAPIEAAVIEVRQSAAVTTDVAPSDILFRTTDTGDTIAQERMRLTRDGLVGIGISSPTYELDVHGPAEIGTVSVAATGYGASGFGGTFSGYRAGGTKTTPTATPSGATMMQTGGGGYTGSAWTIPKAIMRVEADENFSGTNQGCHIEFHTTPIGSTTRTERMRIASNGNVGIAATSLDELLNLYSSTEAKIKINTSHESNYSEIIFYRSEGGTETFGNRIDDNDILGKISFTARWDDEVEQAGEYESAAIICQATEDWTTVNGGGSELLFNTTENGAASQITGMMLSNDRRVGIGDVAGMGYAPEAALHVYDAVSGYAALFENDGGTADRQGIGIQCGLDVASGNDHCRWIDFMDGDGGVVAWMGYDTSTPFAAVHTSSDARLKENIHPAEFDALWAINGLSISSFDWVDESRPHVDKGFVAQQVEEFIPEMVGEGPDGMKSVSEAPLVKYLVKAVQQLSARVVELEARLEEKN